MVLSAKNRAGFDLVCRVLVLAEVIRTHLQSVHPPFVSRVACFILCSKWVSPSLPALMHQLQSSPERPNVTFAGCWNIWMNCNPCTYEQCCNAAPDDVKPCSQSIGRRGSHRLRFVSGVDYVDGHRSNKGSEERNHEEDEEHLGLEWRRWGLQWSAGPRLYVEVLVVSYR